MQVMHTYMYVRVYMCVCLSVCLSVCLGLVCVCVCVCTISLLVACDGERQGRVVVDVHIHNTSATVTTTPAVIAHGRTSG